MNPSKISTEEELPKGTAEERMTRAVANSFLNHLGLLKTSGKIDPEFKIDSHSFTFSRLINEPERNDKKNLKNLNTFKLFLDYRFQQKDGEIGQRKIKLSKVLKAIDWSKCEKKTDKDKKELVADYTGIIYQQINPLLRKGRGLEAARSNHPVDQKIYEDLIIQTVNLVSALKDLPSIKEGNVLRYAQLDSGAIDKYVVGGIRTEKSFLSTTLSKEELSGFPSHRNNTIFEITPLKKESRGKPISHLSICPHEEEVVFLPGTKFRVDSVMENVGEHQRTCIRMTEVA